MSAKPDGSPRNVPMARAMSSVERDNMRFVIFDAPNNSNVQLYLDELTSRNVKCIVRVCEPTYDKAIAERMGIQVYDWAFSDGTCPPQDVIINFLKLCEEKFAVKDSSDTIGIHCIAGLGRAPVLVAIALIESGMIPIEAIEYVRKQRRGAFNSVQLAYLADQYKCMKKKLLNGASPAGDGSLKKKTSGLFDSLSRVFKK
ncbi:UNVERIFIED_CONTAM: Protein tyrosine phosphatase type IVA 1 [Siphonaria sp. JEL0065]|nr:Protein tyrosine phosphatase type IVA 1 [Siphonaria sp. JEL0065]